MSNAAPTLGVEYRSRTQLPPMADRWWLGVLGIAQFGPDPAPLELAQIPVAAVPLSTLGGREVLYEIWRAEAPIQAANFGAVRCRFNDQMLFGCLSIPEPPQAATADDTLKAITTSAYAQIFAALEASGYRQLVRVWNYVSGINVPAHAGERYWQFNSARHESFVAFKWPIHEAAPAASALGTPSGCPLVIYFLASRSAAQMLENPRQVSAYRYPAKHGPRSPTFSRAALLSGGGGTLMISGTASILGHETVHADDVGAQTAETMENIRALISTANRMIPEPRFSIEALVYKVYLRHAASFPKVAHALRALVGPAAAIAFLSADVCRRELLVEIEAVGLGSARG